MSMNDPLANAFSKIMNTERLGRGECTIAPVSKIIKTLLKILNENQLIGKFNEIDNARGGSIVVNLLGRINGCGVIKPRYAIKKDDYEKFEKRYLPGKGFGVLIVSTSQGIMTNEEAKEKDLGGRLLAYCY